MNFLEHQLFCCSRPFWSHFRKEQFNLNWHFLLALGFQELPLILLLCQYFKVFIQSNEFFLHLNLSWALICHFKCIDHPSLVNALFLTSLILCITGCCCFPWLIFLVFCSLVVSLWTFPGVEWDPGCLAPGCPLNESTISPDFKRAFLLSPHCSVLLLELCSILCPLAMPFVCPAVIQPAPIPYKKHVLFLIALTFFCSLRIGAYHSEIWDSI